MCVHAGALASFTFDKDGCGVCMDLKHNAVIERFIPHAKAVTAAELDEENGVLLTGSADFNACLWKMYLSPQERAE